MGVAPSHTDDPWIGKTLAGRYRVVRQLGEGGIGCVYIAEHLTLGRHVALKMLHEHFATTASLRQRFEREARALSRLSHPNVVAVVDFGSSDDSLFLVMELVDGETLADRIRREPPTVRGALEIMRQIVRALAYAHGLGIVHRDLKPGNVLVRRLPDGIDHVTVLDFGLAKFLDEESSAALTRQGAVIGTPAYMAPEQAMGDPATAPADVYAATLILFELLTGRRPFPGKDPGEIFKAHLLSPIPRVADVRPDLGVSAEIEAFIQRGLDKTASRRWKDARAMLEALDAVPELVGRQSLTHGVGAVAVDATVGVESIAVGQGRAAPASFVLGSPVEPPSVAVGSPQYGAVATDVTQLARGQQHAPQHVAETTNGAAARAAELAKQALHPSRRPMLVAAGAVLVLLLIASVAALVVFVTPIGDQSPEPGKTQGTVATPTPTPAVVPVVVPPQNPSATRVPARDPWREAIPPDLVAMRETISSGANPSRGALQLLYHYGAQHRNDPRGFLLLGHTYANRGWEGDAMDAYRDAMARDPSSRGDHRMLNDLVAMAAVERYHVRASSYIVSWFGREALQLVDVRIAEATDPEAKARLEALRASLLRRP